MGAHIDAVEKGHAKRNAALPNQVEQALPDAEPGPADDGLRCSPPRTKFLRDAPPLGAVLVAPEDCADRLPQILMRLLAVRPNLVDQRLQHRPLRVRQHLDARIARHPRRLGTYPWS
jgi:hypothetical protein